MATPTTKTFDFDAEAVEEYFTFKIKGFVYRYRHMTTEELEEMRSLSNDDKRINDGAKDNKVSDKATEFLYSFIEKADPENKETPEWTKLEKTLITPLRVKFQMKLMAEMTGNANI